jgi:hypothetical protein
MNCDEICEKDNVSCNNFECDNFIDYEDDLNCVLVCARKNGPLTLEETSKRLGVSYVRIKQLEDRAIARMKEYWEQERGMAF